MEIKDSGNRREFTSGAVRDIAEDKGRCDLLPLTMVSTLFENDLIYVELDRYIRTGHLEHLKTVFTSFALDRYDSVHTAVLEVAKQYQQGCEKYGERNWEKGIPLHCYIDSATRHYIKYRRGDTDEPHDRAFLWNILGAMWTQVNKPDCCDLPFEETKEGDR